MDNDKLLENINFPSDLKQLNKAELDALCAEIREFLIEKVSKTGGHLASNLGAVELTVGLHYVFNSPVDNIIFDVGHQSYVHKILTGRKEGFDTLRMLDGMSGFQKPSESPHDPVITGHASTGISSSLGIARARTLDGRHNEVVCVIGDGALTGGMAYEALNDAGQSGEKMIIVYNDNEMSIGQNVGAIANRLTHIRSKPRYLVLKNRVKRFLSHFPGGERMISFVSDIKSKIRKAILKESIFEILGFRYLGPVDGNDIVSVCALLEEAKAYKGPVVVHFKTIKGKGYYPSEKSPWDYHGVSPFDMITGIPQASKTTFSDILGAALSELASDDDRICAVTAAMEDGTGLGQFSTLYPSRFFDVGIAEEHAVTMAAGLATQGLKPVFAVYSSFLQRSYDQMIHDVAIGKNHVVFAIDRAGLVGADGETHQGVFDVPYIMSVPGIKLYSPSSYSELETALKHALYSESGPVALRFPRGSEGAYHENNILSPITVIQEGRDVTIASYGIVINNAIEAGRILAEKSISAEIVKINELTTSDFTVLFESVKKTGSLIIAEDCLSSGCFGEKVASELMCNSISAKLALVNLGKTFVEHGKVEELYTRYAIDGLEISKKAEEIINDRKEKA